MSPRRRCSRDLPNPAARATKLLRRRQQRSRPGDCEPGTPNTEEAPKFPQHMPLQFVFPVTSRCFHCGSGHTRAGTFRRADTTEGAQAPFAYQRRTCCWCGRSYQIPGDWMCPDCGRQVAFDRAQCRGCGFQMPGPPPEGLPA